MTATVPSERSSRISVLSAPTWKTRILALTASSRRSLRTGHGARSCSHSPPRTMHSARSIWWSTAAGIPDAVGDQRHRSQDHRHEQEDADVVDARLASIRRSWSAWGHSGTLATIASRDNRATVEASAQELRQRWRNHAAPRELAEDDEVAAVERSRPPSSAAAADAPSTSDPR